ncbi:MAG: hypothetical protein GY913_00200 [Proteobacteria bacterium]|nr:hypothetical protein [Pseudomonadota bacterium]
MSNEDRREPSARSISSSPQLSPSLTEACGAASSTCSAASCQPQASAVARAPYRGWTIDREYTRRP